MPQVQIPDELFEAVSNRARSGGFASVDEYVSQIITSELEGEVDSDAIFTPERLAQIDEGLEDIRQGRVFTSAQVDEELQNRKLQWLKNNPSHK
jgi:predicted transcriptional regulator